MMKSIQYEDVLRFHAKVQAHSGGGDGVRSRALIESALARFDASFGGVDLYDTIAMKAAAVGCGLIQNHGFLDGNKRIGMCVMLLLLKMNGVTLRYTQEELIELIMDLACSKYGTEETAKWIEAHTV